MNEAQELVDGLLAQPWGQVTPSVYETGRVVSLAPWLGGQEQRITYLLDTQQPDGRWGPSDIGYALVPTLSAVEALLVRGRRDSDRPETTRAWPSGLTVLRAWLADAAAAAGHAGHRADHRLTDPGHQRHGRRATAGPSLVGEEMLDLLVAAFQNGA